MLVIISGPSGVGKDTLVRELVARYGGRFETPYTTRQARPDERDGSDYHFVSRDDFQRRVRDRAMVEWDYCLGEYYGFAWSLKPRDNEIVVTHALARMAVRIWARLFPSVRLVFLMPRDSSALAARLEQRCGSTEEVSARLAHGEEEMVHAALFHHLLTVAGGREALAIYEGELRDIFHGRELE